jgi:hypothetical protein
MALSLSMSITLVTTIKITANDIIMNLAELFLIINSCPIKYVFCICTDPKHTPPNIKANKKNTPKDFITSLNFLFSIDTYIIMNANNILNIIEVNIFALEKITNAYIPPNKAAKYIFIFL